MTENNAPLKDSGERTEFETGALRDMHEGKGRFDLMPLDIISKLFGSPYLQGLLPTEKYTLVVFDTLDKFKMTGEVEYLYKAAYEFITKEAVNMTHADKYDSEYHFLLALAVHYENGAKKYGENNWQKGIPVHSCIDSALRHYTKYKCGFNDEPHEIAFVWNIITAIYMLENKPEMDDFTLAREEVSEGGGSNVIPAKKHV